MNEWQLSRLILTRISVPSRPLQRHCFTVFNLRIGGTLLSKKVFEGHKKSVHDSKQYRPFLK